MSRAVKIIHISFTIIAWGIFAASLIRFAVVWSSLPENLGIHFASDGNFDMISKKSYALYPYIVTHSNGNNKADIFDTSAVAQFMRQCF